MCVRGVLAAVAVVLLVAGCSAPSLPEGRSTTSASVPPLMATGPCAALQQGRQEVLLVHLGFEGGEANRTFDFDWANVTTTFAGQGPSGEVQYVEAKGGPCLRFEEGWRGNTTLEFSVQASGPDHARSSAQYGVQCYVTGTRHTPAHASPVYELELPLHGGCMGGI